MQFLSMQFSFAEYKTTVWMMKITFSFVLMAIIQEPQYMEMCSLVWRFSARFISRYVKSYERCGVVTSWVHVREIPRAQNNKTLHANIISFWQTRITSRVDLTDCRSVSIITRYNRLLSIIVENHQFLEYFGWVVPECYGGSSSGGHVANNNKN